MAVKNQALKPLVSCLVLREKIGYSRDETEIYHTN